MRAFAGPAALPLKLPRGEISGANAIPAQLHLDDFGLCPEPRLDLAASRSAEEERVYGPRLPSWRRLVRFLDAWAL